MAEKIFKTTSLYVTHKGDDKLTVIVNWGSQNNNEMSSKSTWDTHEKDKQRHMYLWAVNNCK